MRGPRGQWALPVKPRSSVRQNAAAGTCSLTRAGEESCEWPENTEEEKGVSPSPHLLPPPPSPPPRRARLEVPLSVRAPGASLRPSAVRCAQAGRGRRLLLKVKLSLSNYFSQEREGGSRRGKSCCVWKAHQSEML